MTVTLCSVLTVLSACDHPAAPIPEWDAPDVRPFVSGEALQSISPEGQFLFEDAGYGSIETLTRAEAQEVALAFVRAFIIEGIPPPWGGIGIRAELEEDHGAAIDWESVSVGPRPPFRMETPLDDLPPELPRWVINGAGPHYVVPLMAGGRQVAIITVAVTADLFVHDGQIVRSGEERGNEFTWAGTRLGSGPWPLQPEVAVRHAACSVRTRVRTRPLLLRWGARYVPSLGRWVVRFEEPVDLRMLDDGEPVRSDVVYLQYPSGETTLDARGRPLGVRFMVPAPTQPTEEMLPVVVDGEWEHVPFPIDPDFPVNFIEVEPDAEATALRPPLAGCP
jgi:hypothetical protein